MKKVLLFFLILLLYSCSNKYEDLFNITDEFVEKLQTTYERYGIFSGVNHTKYTKNMEYKVLPIGRLINVRIEHTANSDEYKELCEALEAHYNDDYRVNKVFINNGGTITIDCRN